MSEINQLRESISQIYGMEPDQAMEQLLGIYKHAKSLQKALSEIADSAKEVMTEIITETGQTDWKTDSGRCYITRSGLSVRYDAKLLDKLAADDPKVEELLAPYRKEVERPGVLTVR